MQQAMAKTTPAAKAKGLLFLVGGVILLVLVLWAAAIIIRDVTPGASRRFFDRPVLDFVLGFRASSLTPLMKFFSFFGSTGFGVVVLVALMFISFALTKDVRFPIFFALMLLGSFVIDDVVKEFVALRRPPVRALVGSEGPGFPSGHTTTAAAVAYAVAFLIVERRPTHPMVWVWPTMSMIAVLVGFSRCYLGVAWPTDVLAGYALGVGYGTVVGTSVKTFFGYQRLWPRRAMA